MRRSRRRTNRDLNEARQWADQRQEAIASWMVTGLGLRPYSWWLFESTRPDLAESPGIDLYCHLREDAAYVSRASARLRFLIDSGELSPAEADTIRAEAATEREPGRWAWRAAVLTK